LKQSPREWNIAIDSLLMQLNFKSLGSENCIYHGLFKGKTCFVVLYVLNPVRQPWPRPPPINNPIPQQWRPPVNNPFPAAPRDTGGLHCCGIGLLIGDGLGQQFQQRQGKNILSVDYLISLIDL
jgi:hypothetical protein